MEITLIFNFCSKSSPGLILELEGCLSRESLNVGGRTGVLGRPNQKVIVLNLQSINRHCARQLPSPATLPLVTDRITLWKQSVPLSVVLSASSVRSPYLFMFVFSLLCVLCKFCNISFRAFLLMFVFILCFGICSIFLNGVHLF